MLAERIPDIQQALAEVDLDGWIFCIFQHQDPVSLELLGLSGHGLVTRRCYYLIPRSGEPRRLVHELEPAMLDELPGSKSHYLTWEQHRRGLEELVQGMRRLAAQYSPNNMLPTISRLDAGTAEFLRGLNIEIASSAELVQQFAAVWSAEQLESHRRASTHLHRIVLDAFDQVAAALKRGAPIDEYAVQRYISERFENAGLHTMADAIVGVNANSADAHYQPSADVNSPIEKGDFLLIDLWAKEKSSPDSIYADICWVAVCDSAPTDRQQEVFDLVVRARDASLEVVQSRYPAEAVRGFEVDAAGRRIIEEAGYGSHFIHRTGHSLGIEDHGHGANMDDLETHDTRRLVPMTGFSIEPGIYLTGDFGVRSEINVALTPEGAEVTGGEPQRELIRLL
jgi:Xaa-Pro aminopeptidase